MFCWFALLAVGSIIQLVAVLLLNMWSPTDDADKEILASANNWSMIVDILTPVGEVKP